MGHQAQVSKPARRPRMEYRTEFSMTDFTVNCLSVVFSGPGNPESEALDRRKGVGVGGGICSSGGGFLEVTLWPRRPEWQLPSFEGACDRRRIQSYRSRH